MSRWLIDKAGVKITVRCKGDAAEQLLHPLMEDLAAVRVTAPSGVRLSVKGKPGEWHLRDRRDHIKRKIKLTGDLIYHLSDRIVFHIADKSNSVHCLHAAAAAYNGKALVLPASSGSGKSTFIAWLVANGFKYLTDELILLDGNQLQGIARPIQIKAHGVDTVKSLLEQPELLIEGKMTNAVSPSALGGETATDADYRIGMIVYLEYDSDAGFEFEQLSSSDAGMNLMANHVNARNLEGHGFREMMEMIRNTPCYRLRYGGFANLPDGFSDHLKQILDAL